jgi:L-lysine 2,3-aminomutase
LEQIKVLRIHTKLPISNPKMINNNILKILKKRNKILYVSLEINQDRVAERFDAQLSNLSVSQDNIANSTVGAQYLSGLMNELVKYLMNQPGTFVSVSL